MKIERLNLVAVPCRQRPKRGTEARQSPAIFFLCLIVLLGLGLVQRS